MSLTYDHLAAVLQQQLHARAGDPPALAWRNINIIRAASDLSVITIMVKAPTPISAFTFKTL